MSLADIGPWLLTRPKIQSILEELQVELARAQLGDMTGSDLASFEIGNFNYLLLIGSLFSASGRIECEDAALRIAHFLLSAKGAPDSVKSGALLIFDQLANRVSAELAVKRGWVSFDPRQSNNALIQLDYEIGEERNLVTLTNGEKIYLNRFQRDAWDLLHSEESCSLSAPTSAGKSYVVKQWLLDKYQTTKVYNAVFLVPTRALIYQTELEMRRLIRERNLADKVHVSTIPSLQFVANSNSNLFIFTQERFHVLQNLSADLVINSLVVDEAQKVGDGGRGVLLQQVIENAKSNNSNLRLIYLTPSTNNASIFFSRQSEASGTIAKDNITVGQNLFWVEQEASPEKLWRIDIWRGEKRFEVKKIKLKHEPNTDPKRLSFVSYGIAGNSSGNLIYVNGAADAEKVALQLFELLEGPDLSSDEELKKLIDFVGHAIHRKYALCEVLKKGVAFHYGNMPLLIRAEIERLFSKNKIKYLICTSTLVEGVNMSCRNIFLRGPKKGRLNLMDEMDFWNLAGRAGRWGKEFEGNIFCIDSNRPTLWKAGSPPRSRTKYNIERTTTRVLGDVDSVLAFINSGTKSASARQNPDLAFGVSYLYAKYVNKDLSSIRDFLEYSGEDFDRVNEGLAASMSKLTISKEVIVRNPGINPLLMEDLIDYFRSRGKNPEEHAPLPPHNTDAVNRYISIFTNTYKYLGSNLGEGGRAFGLAMLVVHWMRGYPLSRLINEKYDRDFKKNPKTKMGQVIRTILEEVEKYARYEAPKYIACYSDVLSQYYHEIKRPELAEQLEDYSIYLEFGVSQGTQVSLMSLGLSRTAAINISEYIVEDNLSETECVIKLRSMDFDRLVMPSLVVDEIERFLNGISN